MSCDTIAPAPKKTKGVADPRRGVKDVYHTQAIISCNGVRARACTHLRGRAQVCQGCYVRQKLRQAHVSVLSI